MKIVIGIIMVFVALIAITPFVGYWAYAYWLAMDMHSHTVVTDGWIPVWFIGSIVWLFAWFGLLVALDNLVS